VKDEWIRYMVNSQMIRSSSKLAYGERDYLRVPPEDHEGEDAWTSPHVAALPWEGKPGDWRFETELEEYYRFSGGRPGEAFLNVLYYPGLQEIQILVDGNHYEASLDTYWQKRDTFRLSQNNEHGEFHGLKISGLPGKGNLFARVRFTGYRWANLISLFALAIVLGVSLYVVVRNRNTQ
jgi:hypothetical protein